MFIFSSDPTKLQQAFLDYGVADPAVGEVTMKSHALVLVPALFLLHPAWAEEKSPAWRSDTQHPQLQYRSVCIGGSSVRVVWRNGYPGAVTLKAHMKSFSYDGMEDVRIDPGGTTKSDLETIDCQAMQVSVTRFSMAAPPPPPPPSADAKTPA